MEAGFGNPLLYFNKRENYYTHVLNSYVDHVLLETPIIILVFLKLIGTISVYSVNAEWNSSAERLWNGTERNEITVPGVNVVLETVEDTLRRQA